MRHGLPLASVLFAVITTACGGADTPTAPTATSSFSTGGGASIVSCNSVRYQNQAHDVCRAITGQAMQHTGASLFFPGRSDCLNVSCSNGCATSVSVGVASGGSCR